MSIKFSEEFGSKNSESISVEMCNHEFLLKHALTEDEKRNEVMIIRKMMGWHALLANTRGQIAIVRSCDENRGRNSMKRIMTAEVNGRHSRGRQKKRWGDMIQQGKKSLRLKREHTADRKKWRGRIRVADRSPVRD